MAISGNGFYPGTVIKPRCYQSGAANVPGSANAMWEQASWAGGPGRGSGWINEHFINDGVGINEHSPGVPPCNSPPQLPAGQFRVMNAAGGIYWRSSPDWNTAVASPGNGFYPGTVIKPRCYQSGAANVPGSANAMWEQASWVSGPGSGSGWINEHFINDGVGINQHSPDVPPCARSGTAPEGASVFFRPMKGASKSAATTDLSYAGWKGSGCSMREQAVDNPFKGKWISALASWSDARLAPIFFLHARPDQRTHIHYMLIIDPGTKTQMGQSCAAKTNPAKTLADWASLPGTRHLLIVSAEATAHDHHQALEPYFLKDLRGRHLMNHVLVCKDDRTEHTQAYLRYAGAGSKYIPTQKFQCPYGVPPL